MNVAVIFGNKHGVGASEEVRCVRLDVFTMVVRKGRRLWYLNTTLADHIRGRFDHIEVFVDQGCLIDKDGSAWASCTIAFVSLNPHRLCIRLIWV